MATIQILGTGCARCGHLWMNARRAVEDSRRSDTIEKVTDYDRILSYLPAALPALVVDGQVVSAGDIPTPTAIVGWLQAADRARATAASQNARVTAEAASTANQSDSAAFTSEES